MHSPIANVNGVAVYSDKSLSGITNDLLQFSDGSYANVRTGEVHNAGPGYISLGQTPSAAAASSKTVTWGPERVQAGGVYLINVAAEVAVQVHDGTDVEYTVEGPEDELDRLSFSTPQGVLRIEGVGGDGSDGISVQSGPNGTIVVGRGSSIISSGSIISGAGSVISSATGGLDARVKLTLKVPRGAAVSARGIRHNFAVGDTLGPLALAAQGTPELRVGRVGDTQLTLQGAVQAHVRSIVGGATIATQGASHVEVQDADITALQVNMQGAGSVTIGGSAQTATLSAMGVAKIDLAHCASEPMNSSMGMANIRVRRIG